MSSSIWWFTRFMFFCILTKLGQSALTEFSAYRDLLKSFPDYLEDGCSLLNLGDIILLPVDICKENPNFTSPTKVKETRDRILSCDVQDVDCEGEEDSPYRTIDGSCNNLDNPSWGMSGSCYRRVLPHDYADGKSDARISCTGGSLPNPRGISNTVHQVHVGEWRPQSNGLSVTHMEWGQLVAHDISLAAATPVPDNGYGSCCNKNSVVNDKDKCISFPPPLLDPFFTGKRGCLPVSRTLRCPQCPDVRETQNLATSCIDLSIVYGFTTEEAGSIRTFKNGTLKTEKTHVDDPLPDGVDKVGDCVSDSKYRCFKAGDIRINLSMILCDMHIVLLRHHNYLCSKLKAVHSDWNDEKLYQEARRINIAVFQHITYCHYLPKVIGHTHAKHFNLLPNENAEHTTYDPSVDPTAIDEYAATAGRFGHTMIPDSYKVANTSNAKGGIIKLEDHYNQPQDFYLGITDGLAKGMGLTCPKNRDAGLDSVVRNRLEQDPKRPEKGGMDLAALSIARNADHGMPGYVNYMKAIYDMDMQSFKDLTKTMCPESAFKLQSTYASAHDVNAYSGTLSEKTLPCALLGPLGVALVTEQFKKVKYGDRFFYEHGNQSGSFTKGQLMEIKKMSYANMLCRTCSIDKIQKDVFCLPSQNNTEVSCDSLSYMNMSLF